LYSVRKVKNVSDSLAVQGKNHAVDFMAVEQFCPAIANGHAFILT